MPGLRPLSAYDHAPDPSDHADTCHECGRRAPEAFDHNPKCSHFEPIDTAP